MRKITEQAVQAFNNNQSFNNSNTSVEVNCEGTFLMLFGNTIAGNDSEGFWISLAGYNTKTTKERLNGLDDVSIYTSKAQLQLNDFNWDGKKIFLEKN